MDKVNFLIPELEHFEEMWEMCSLDYKQRFYAGWVAGLLGLRADCMDEMFEGGHLNARAFMEARKNGDE